MVSFDMKFHDFTNLQTAFYGREARFEINKIENIIGIPTLIPCLFIGFLWGLYATIKGSWF